MTDFNARVLELVKLIPEGKLSTYKRLALALKKPNASRVVGNALHANPEPIKVPCHRVVKENGFIGGFGLGVKKKKALLESEGIKFKGNKILNFHEAKMKEIKERARYL